jgi:hypothetical protein
VTEEDIALCMGEFYMPADSDLESGEHPLRVLSTENLTVVSTFTGKKRNAFFPNFHSNDMECSRHLKPSKKENVYL